MKVLLLFPMADGQTGPAIKYAFEKLGHEVRAVDAKLEPQKSYVAACEFIPDLVFCSRTHQLTEDVVTIKKWFKNAVICMYNHDTRTHVNHWKRLFPLIRLCDYYFVPDIKTIPRWKGINQNTFWLPQGLQNEVYHKPERITEKDKEKYSCDVCWAGNIEKVHRARKPFMAAVEQMGLNFKQWGCKGNPTIYDEEHNKMVSLSKINLCCSGWPKNEKYVPCRNYKMMGAGGFVLELYRNKIYEIFPRDIFDCYTDPINLVEKIKYWLSHEKERKETAEKGYKWVHAHGTYTHRIKMALNYMEI